LNSQVVGNGRTRPVSCPAHGRGPVHDFALSKQSKLELHERLEVRAGSGYQGSAKLPDKRRPPKKRAPQVQRTKAEKRANRALAQRRSVVEHVMRRLQILRILLER